MAVGRGALVYPFRWQDRTLPEFAAQVGAVVAVPRRAVSAEQLAGPATVVDSRRHNRNRGVGIKGSMDGGADRGGSRAAARRTAGWR